MNTLSDRLQTLRKKVGLSQKDLADKIKISKSMLSRYENHNVQPPADILNKLSNALNTSVDFLLNGTKDEKAKASLKNTELLQTFKEVDEMPDKDQSLLLHFINVYLRDFKTRKAYAK
jgi:transcriptional regulator with XRE-family HTH domain